MKTSLMFFAAMGLLLFGCAGSKHDTRNEGGMDEATRLQADQEEHRRANDNIGSGPLGTQTNPIKCDGLEGARAYLDQLQGPRGQKITYTDEGSAGVGPFGSLLYLFNVSYPNMGEQVETQLFFDIDFAEHKENHAAAGFLLK
ncbi:MAG TPA: hypothetical protein VLM37_03605 [Fibrobacteraceae bacterium]|nr:hypothetical protein [Fibrobacteraceae bacterium]